MEGWRRRSSQCHMIKKRQTINKRMNLEAFSAVIFFNLPHSYLPLAEYATLRKQSMALWIYVRRPQDNTRQWLTILLHQRMLQQEFPPPRISHCFTKIIFFCVISQFERISMTNQNVCVELGCTTCPRDISNQDGVKEQHGHGDCTLNKIHLLTACVSKRQEKKRQGKTHLQALASSNTPRMKL